MADPQLPEPMLDSRDVYQLALRLAYCQGYEDGEHGYALLDEDDPAWGMVARNDEAAQGIRTWLAGAWPPPVGDDDG